MRVVVTNDDGAGTTGISVLARTLADAGHEVAVVAPDGDRSGAGTGLGRVLGGQSLSWSRRDHDGRIPVYAVDAPPAMCVLAALEGLAGSAPDLVVSGINHGPNLGFAVLHSGTVGAALTAHLAGTPALAVSVGEPAEGLHGSPVEADHPVWGRASQLVVALVARIDEWGTSWVPNLNVPSAWTGERAPVGARLAQLGAIGLAFDPDGGDAPEGASATVTVSSAAHLDDTPVPSDRWPTDMAMNAVGTPTLTPLSGITLAAVDPAPVDRLVATLAG